jgi:hypothetical protein
MIILLRVINEDGRVIHAEAYVHDERLVDHRHPYERCRCIPEPTWRVREYDLKQEFKSCKVTTTSIYLSNYRTI